MDFNVWAMGTENTVIIGDGPEFIDDMRTEDWVRSELERLEQCWSRFRPDSDLNLWLAGKLTDLPDSLLLILDCAARLWHATDGLFDVRIRSSLEALGYDRPYRSLDLSDEGHRVAQASSQDRSTLDQQWPGFVVDLTNRAAQFDPGVLLDLGGVGKGLAADLIAEQLIHHGARSVCISLGGDIRTKGVGPHRGGWDIPINNPYGGSRYASAIDADADEVFTTHHSVDGALVMSTVGFRRWGTPDDPHNETLHHLIDPRTGTSSGSGIRSVAATGAQAWWCEGVAKAALIAGPDEAIDLLERLGVDGWVFLDTGEIITTALIA
jgi:FAD:protein FMN transferase